MTGVSDDRDTVALYTCPRCNYAFPEDAQHDCTRTVWRRLWPLWMATAILSLIVSGVAGGLWAMVANAGYSDSLAGVALPVTAAAPVVYVFGPVLGG